MDNIKIIKLENGDDLIASVTVNNNKYILSEPMRFYVDIRNGNSLVMQHYLPVQLIKDNLVVLKEKHILAIVEPDIEFIEYYQHTIEKIKRLLQAKKDIETMTDEELNNIINQMDMETNVSGIYH